MSLGLKINKKLCFKMPKLLYLFLFCVVPMEAQFSNERAKVRGVCSRPELNHGYVRMKQHGRTARFACKPGFDIVGDKYSTCIGGKWDTPTPVCVRGGCTVPKVENAIILPTHKNAYLNIFCLPKYKGSATIFCDGHNWNGSTPVCVRDAADEPLSCDFETPELCGWVQDSRHDFDWSRINKKTPSAFLFTGPASDHTFGDGKQGYYMYIESSSKSENDTARLISPVYSGDLERNGCFSFFYHMYGRSIGGLRVYQIPESQKDQILDERDTKNQYLLFEKWGNQGDEWYRNVSYLKGVSDNFQIVIEGVRGTSFTSDIAIDDVALLTGHQCEEAIVSAVTPADIPDSCAGRCSDETTPQRGCGCSTACISDSDCCADFLELCVFNPDLQNFDYYDTTTTKNPRSSPRTSDHPRTEKLIGSTRRTYNSTTSTSTTTTTTPKLTTNQHYRAYPTTKAATRTSTVTKSPPKTTTAKPNATIAKTTTPPTTKMNTVRLTTKVVKMTNTTTAVTFRTRLDGNKAKKDDHEAKKLGKENEGSTGAVVTMVLILFVVVCVGAVLVARSARGKAALAQLRGRASSDPEVRYLTSDHD